jgi:hypothetical protein
MKDSMSWLEGAAFLGITTALACSSSSGGGGAATVTGTVAGAQVPTTDAIAIVAPLVETFGGFTQEGVTVAITNLSPACSFAQPGGDSNPPNSTILLMEVGSPQAVTPGTYSIIATTPTATTINALLVFEAVDGQCKQTSLHAARSGTITFSTISATAVVGSFDVTFNTGENLTGSFDAPICVVNTNVDAGPAPACGP